MGLGTLGAPLFHSLSSRCMPTHKVGSKGDFREGKSGSLTVPMDCAIPSHSTVSIIGLNFDLHLSDSCIYSSMTSELREAEGATYWFFSR